MEHRRHWRYFGYALGDVQIDVGRIVAGKYELVRLIGKGAMGEVWLAKHTSLGGEFAIKLADPAATAGDDSAAGRFQLEAQLSARFARKTRHIVSVSDHGEEGDVAYLVMELLDGEALDARLVRTGPLAPAEVSRIVGQIARALAVAHAEETFHRDLKPANVFLTHDEDGRLLVKLFDFGIARTRKVFTTASPFATSKDMVLGTPSYMSPEQARGLKTLDHRCDVWALAVLAYEALSGTIPWQGETVEEIFLAICTFQAVPISQRSIGLTPGLDTLFAKAFAPKLDARFPSAVAFAAALREICAPDDVPSSRTLPSASDPELPALGGEVPSVPTGIMVSEQTGEARRAKGKLAAGWVLFLGAFVALALAVVVGVVMFRAKADAHAAEERAAARAPQTETQAVSASAVPAPDTSAVSTEAPRDAHGATPPPAVVENRETPAAAAPKAQATIPPTRSTSAQTRPTHPAPRPHGAEGSPKPTAPAEPTAPRPPADRSNIF